MNPGLIKNLNVRARNVAFGKRIPAHKAIKIMRVRGASKGEAEQIVAGKKQVRLIFSRENPNAGRRVRKLEIASVFGRPLGGVVSAERRRKTLDKK